MNIGICILLLYITPMLLCLASGIVINWKYIETLGDLLCPLFPYEDRESNLIIYLPIVNIVSLVFIIIFWIYLFFRQVFCKWTPISKYVSRFFNIKIK